MNEELNPEVNPEMEETEVPQNETKQVVVYPAETIKNVLAALDGSIPVKGIETMRGIIEVFDVLNKGGVVQDAVDMGENGYGSPELGFQPRIVPDTEYSAEEPSFAGEETEVYNPAEEETPITEGVPVEE